MAKREARTIAQAVGRAAHVQFHGGGQNGLGSWSQSVPGDDVVKRPS